MSKILLPMTEIYVGQGSAPKLLRRCLGKNYVFICMRIYGVWGKSDIEEMIEGWKGVLSYPSEEINRQPR